MIGITIAGLVILVVFGWSFGTHLQDEKKRRAKLKVYAENGGMPYENPRHSKLSKEAWEHQNETNRRAREIAKLGEYADGPRGTNTAA